MRRKTSRVSLAVAVCAATLFGAGTLNGLRAQQAPRAPAGDPMAAPDAQGGNGADLGPGLFALADRNTDGAVNRAELEAALGGFVSEADTAKAGAVSEADLAAAVKLVQPRLPLDSHMQAMLAALPEQAAAKPKRARKVLVLNKTSGFIHTPIPLAGKMIEAFGNKTKAWSTTITYDPADINAANLKQYDALVLNSTTGAFLDVPNDQAATDARRKALLEFVRGGKGLVGIHGTGDSYHASSAAPGQAAGRGGRGGGAQRGPGATLAAQMVSQGDKNADQKLSADEAKALAGVWFEKLDTAKSGSVRQAEFVHQMTQMTRPANGARAEDPMAGMNMNPPAAAEGRGARGERGGGGPAQGRDTQVGTWPDYNKMIGGFFKFHFGNQPITLKIDDPKSPLTAMFKGQPLEMRGEIYTFGMDTWSRENLHVLTSVDYAKMSDTDKAKEAYPRSDHDYGLTWIHRDGTGRVFYYAFGNEEKTFFIKPLNEHLLAGIQYALGDLQADDSPSGKAGTR